MTQHGHHLSLKEKFSYGLGDAASNLFWMSIIFFQLYFYTDVFGISPEAAGVMIFITRLLDTANDPIMGMIGDRTKSRWGRFRPYILFGAIPFGIAGTLVFLSPDLGPDGKLVYAYISYSLFLLAYTAVNIPYSSLMGVISSDPAERTSVSTFRFTFAQAGGLLVQVSTLYLVEFFGSGDQALGFRVTMGLYGVMAAVFFLITFYGTRERVEPPVSQQSADTRKELFDLLKNIPLPLLSLIALIYFINRPSPVPAVIMLALFAATYLFIRHQVRQPADQVSNTVQDLKYLVTNVPWLILSVIGVLTLLWVSMKNGVTVYYFKYFIQGGLTLPLVGELSNSTITSIFMGGGTLSVIVGTMCTRFLVDLFDSKVRLFIFLMLLNGVSILFVYFLSPGDIYLIFALHLLGSFLGGPPIVIIFSMYADTADYSEWKNGRRATGLIFSAAGFSQKMGWTIGPAFAGVLLGYYGFEANMPQNEQTLHGLRMLIAVIPGIIAFTSGLIMFFYPLKKEVMEKIEKDLEARKADA